MGLTDRHVEAVRKGARVSSGLSTRNQHPRSSLSPTSSIRLSHSLYPPYLSLLPLRNSLPLSLSFYPVLSFPLRNVDTLHFRRSFVRRFVLLIPRLHPDFSARYTLIFFRERERERGREREGEVLGI